VLITSSPLTHVSALYIENREALALPICVSLARLSLIWIAVWSESKHTISTHNRLSNSHRGRAWTSDSDRGTCVLFSVRSQLS